MLDPMDAATVKMSVCINSGSRDEAPHEYGITHFTEHAICMGTKHHQSSADIRNYINENGGTIGGVTYKGKMLIWGHILPENVNILATTIAQQLRESLFDAQKLINERNVILDEFRRSANNFEKFIIEKLFEHSGYAHNIIGTPDTIKSFTANQANQYLNKILSAQNTIICITGKIENPTKLLNTLEKLFSWIPQLPVSHATTKLQTGVIAHDEKNEQKNTKICIAFKNHISITPETQREQIAQDKYRAILKQKLQDTVREKNGLVYNINTNKIGDKYAVANIISTETAPENVASVIALIAQTCRNTKITHADIQRMNAKDKFDYATVIENISNRHRIQLDSLHNFGTLRNIENDINANETITADEVINTAHNFFTSPVSIITQGPTINTDLEKIWHNNF